MRYAMIMAGGKGTRLWPMSREDRPKQLLPFIERAGPSGADRVSLLGLASERLGALVPEDRRYLCTAERFRAQALGGLDGFSDDRILGEPEGRDTANAVALGAAVIGRHDPDAVVAVLSADQIIEPTEAFARAVDVGYRLVERDPARLVTFGITPTFPATGYGYIERADAIGDTDGLGFRVARFIEKPDRERAEAYLAAGTFFWNAGMFVFHAGTFLRLLERHLPASFEGIMRIREAWDTPARRAVLDAVYPTLPKISVDYAIMEPAGQDPDVSICGVEMAVRWLDVGSWPSFAETLAPDASGNRRAGPADTPMIDCRNTLVVGDVPGHTIAVLGCEDLVVVHTERATLVMPASRAQDLKTLHAALPESLR